MVHHIARRFAAIAVVAMLLMAAGCGSAGSDPMDEGAARVVLAKTLDAWVAGAPVANLRAESPEIIVVDEDWTSGARLVDYEVVGTGMFDGKNLRAPVNLTLARTPRGAAQKITAKFIVGLQPVITVVRVTE